jgi:hypothetical protein
VTAARRWHKVILIELNLTPCIVIAVKAPHVIQLTVIIFLSPKHVDAPTTVSARKTCSGRRTTVVTQRASRKTRPLMLAHDDLVDTASINIAAKAHEPTTAQITVCEIVPCQVLNLRL